MPQDSVPPDVAAAIARELDAIEAERGITILFAVESGSRAWGFASPDSDWDVRFVYAPPRDKVVTLWPGRDTIEEKADGDLDLAGWRSDKALKLLLNGNCSLREWMASPIVYRGQYWIEQFKALADDIPCRNEAAFHYRALMLSIWHKYIAEKETFSLKRYLYVLRPALALDWLRQHSEGLPPMDMPSLLASTCIPSPVRHEIDDLLARKALASEIGVGVKISCLHGYAQRAMDPSSPIFATGKHPLDPMAHARANLLYHRTVEFASRSELQQMSVQA